MDAWEEFTETSLPEDCYSNLNIEDTRDADYIHAKRVCWGFKIKNLGEYHNLYLKSDTLLLTNVFENFLKMCMAIYHLDSPIFIQLQDQHGKQLQKDWSNIKIIDWY